MKDHTAFRRWLLSLHVADWDRWQHAKTMTVGILSMVSLLIATLDFLAAIHVIAATYVLVLNIEVHKRRLLRIARRAV